MKNKQSTATRQLPLQGPTLLSLPLDVLVPVALHLPQRYLVRLGCVCRQLHQLALVDQLWARLTRDLRPSRWMDRVVVFDEFIDEEPDDFGVLDVPANVLARHNSLRFVWPAAPPPSMLSAPPA